MTGGDEDYQCYLSTAVNGSVAVLGGSDNDECKLET